MNNYNDWNLIMESIYRGAVSIISKTDLADNATVVFDIDDTLVLANGRGIMPMIQLYNYFVEQGLNVIVITNRSETAEVVSYTKKQLTELGLKGDKVVYFRPLYSTDPYEYKENARKDATSNGFNIVMSIGDMPWDIGEYGGIGIVVPVLRV